MNSSKARAIQRWLKLGFTVAAVADEFGVSKDVVRDEKRAVIASRLFLKTKQPSAAERRQIAREYNRRWRFKRDLKKRGLTDEQIAYVISRVTI